jgi:endonuclease/exonuclease/phosphatase family metal-dependent hydrolase
MRFVTLNLWGTHPPVVPRLDEAARQLSALAPDVVLLQEIRVGEGQPNTAGELAARLGPEWQMAYGAATVGPAGTFGPGSPAGEEGLAIVARHPIEDVRTLVLPDSRPNEGRLLLSGKVNGVWCHSTHLHWRVKDGICRERQVVAIDEAIEAIGDKKAVHVLGGDFNATPDSDEIRFLRGLCTLGERRTSWQDAWLRIHGAETGPTWIDRNPYTRELAFLETPRRIDFLFVSTEDRRGRGKVLDCQVVLDTPGDGGVWPSDHVGVLAEVKV